MQTSTYFQKNPLWANEFKAFLSIAQNKLRSVIFYDYMIINVLWTNSDAIERWSKKEMALLESFLDTGFLYEKIGVFSQLKQSFKTFKQKLICQKNSTIKAHTLRQIYL